MVETRPDAIAVSVILHDVLAEHRGAYEKWIEDATATHRRYAGYLGTDIIRPVESGSRFVIILRFVDEACAHAWMRSDDRRQLLKIAEPWLADADRYQVHRDPEFWFAPPSRRQPPKRWKQWVLSAIAVFPLAAVLPRQIGEVVRVHLPAMPLLFASALTAVIISGLMVYVLMPLLIRMTGAWLQR